LEMRKEKRKDRQAIHTILNFDTVANSFKIFLETARKFL